MKHAGVVIYCIVIFLSGLWLSSYLQDCSHAARTGALLVGGVVLIEGWRLLVTKHPEHMPMWRNPESHRAGKIALLAIFIGTLIQGYGDLAAKGLHLCQ